MTHHSASAWTERSSGVFSIRVPSSDPAPWVDFLLQQLAQYPVPIGAGHKILAGMPIDKDNSELNGFVFVEHPDDPARLLILGVSERERLATDRVSTEGLVALIGERDPDLVTDTARPCWLKDPTFADRLAATPTTAPPEYYDPRATVDAVGRFHRVLVSPETRVGLMAYLPHLPVGTVLQILGEQVIALSRGESFRFERGDDRIEVVLTELQIDRLATWPDALPQFPLAMAGQEGDGIVFASVHAAPMPAVALLNRTDHVLVHTVGLGELAGAELCLTWPPDREGNPLETLAAFMGNPAAAQRLPHAEIQAPPAYSGHRFVLRLFESLPGNHHPLLEIVPADGAWPAGPKRTANHLDGVVLDLARGALAPTPNPLVYQAAHRVIPALAFEMPAEMFESCRVGGDQLRRGVFNLLGQALAIGVTQRWPLIDGWQIYWVPFPKPTGLTEAYGVVLARREDLPDVPRVFVIEPTGDKQVVVSEWRLDTRLRGAQLEPVQTAVEQAIVNALLAQHPPVRIGANLPPWAEIDPPWYPQRRSKKTSGPPPRETPAEERADETEHRSGASPAYVVGVVMALIVGFGLLTWCGQSPPVAPVHPREQPASAPLPVPPAPPVPRTPTVDRAACACALAREGLIPYACNDIRQAMRRPFMMTAVEETQHQQRVRPVLAAVARAMDQHSSDAAFVAFCSAR